jgi:hypothetical protein
MLNEQKYWLASCRSCHERIEMNRAWAYEQGYLLDRLGKIEPDPSMIGKTWNVKLNSIKDKDL